MGQSSAPDPGVQRNFGARSQGVPVSPVTALGLPRPELPTWGAPLRQDSDIPSLKEARAVPPVGDRGLSELGTATPLPLSGGGPGG